MAKRWGGVALPFGEELKTFIEDKTDEQVIRSAIQWLLLTRKGERVMLPEFGSRIPDLVFEPNDDVAVAEVHDAVVTAIRTWDDRIQFEEVLVAREGHVMTIKVLYRDAKDSLASEVKTVSLQLTSGEAIFL